MRRLIALASVALVTCTGSLCQSVQTNPSATQTVAQPSGTSFNVTGGNVGIGTTNPAQYFTIYSPGQKAASISGNSGFQLFLMGNQDSLGANGPAILGSANQNFFMGTGTSWSDPSGGNWNFNFTFGSNGNLGIGTMNPNAELHIHTGVAQNEVGEYINNTDSTGYSVLRLGTDVLGEYGAALHHFNAQFVGDPSSSYAPSTTTLAGFESGGITFATLDPSAPMRFFMGGSAAANERMRITPNGNVGIGTTAPAYALDVNGQARVQSLMFPDGSSLTTAHNAGSNGQLAVSGSGGATLTLQSTAPQGGGSGASVNVFSNLRSWSVVSWNSGNGGIYPGSLGILDDNASVVRQLFDANGDVYIGGKTNDGTVNGSSLNVLANGNVGVDTTNPAYTLDVNGAINAQSILVNGTPIGTVSSSSPTFSGNVGIGTTSPAAAALQVVSPAVPLASTTNAFGNGNVIIESTGDRSTTSGAALTFAADAFGPGSYPGKPYYWESGRIITVADDSSSPSASGRMSLQTRYKDSAGNWQWNNGLLLTAGGNVGIGTTSPTSTLEVDGNLTLTAASGAHIVFPDQTVQATAWNGTTCGGDYAEAVDITGEASKFEAGDILAIDPDHPGQFTLTSGKYSTLVAGVFSTKPGLTGRRVPLSAGLSNELVPMALVGIVPVKVTAENGPVHVGDLIVSSSLRGKGMRGDRTLARSGTLVGKALGNVESGIGVIDVLLSLN